MMEYSKRPKILLLFEKYPETPQFLNGLLGYAKHHGPWEFVTDNFDIQIIPGIEPIDQSQLTDFDGAAAVVTARYCFEHYKQPPNFKNKIPIIDFYGPTDCLIPNAQYITSDNEMIGRLAAKEFLHSGLPNIAYFGSSLKYYFSLSRYQGILKITEPLNMAVSYLGFTFAEYQRTWTDQKFKQRLSEQIKTWLENLPKPVGVLLSTDRFFHYILPHCRELGLRIPQDISFIGVNNNLDCCTLSEITLSSIDTNRYQIGWRVGELLDDIIQGRLKQRHEEFIEPKGIVVRESSSYTATNDQLVASGLDYIKSNIRENLSVKEISNALGVSRSNLDKRFKKSLGITAGKAIDYQRANYMRKMLLDTTFTLCKISELSGFTKQSHFTRYFKQAAGISPSEYRKKKGWNTLNTLT